jgi:phosphohistidine phosphatase
MPRLLLMRHAKSSWSDPRQLDHDRPLNDRGLKTAPRMGRWLMEQGLQPELVVCSTACRAATTAALVAQTLDTPPSIEHYPALYHAMPDDMIEVLATETDGADLVMLVAHNPGIEEFIHHTTGAMEFCPTAVIALIEFQGEWSDLLVEPRGELKALWRPKSLPDE